MKFEEIKDYFVSMTPVCLSLSLSLFFFSEFSDLDEGTATSPGQKLFGCAWCHGLLHASKRSCFAAC